MRVQIELEVEKDTLGRILTATKGIIQSENKVKASRVKLVHDFLEDCRKKARRVR